MRQWYIYIFIFFIWESYSLLGNSKRVSRFLGLSHYGYQLTKYQWSLSRISYFSTKKFGYLFESLRMSIEYPQYWVKWIYLVDFLPAFVVFFVCFFKHFAFLQDEGSALKEKICFLHPSLWLVECIHRKHGTVMPVTCWV